MKQVNLDRSVHFMKDWLRFLYERGDTPGFVIAVSHKGKVIFNEGYGYADLEHKTKMTPVHVFRIASHSKTFTATAIMQLQEQGKLRIDDYVVDYVPWLKQHKDRRFRKITIRQVLSHGAGIMRDGTDESYWGLHRPFPNAAVFKNEMLAAGLVLDNNVKLKYSNYGYTLLGCVIESVTGQSYNDYVLGHIVGPLGLEDTGPELTEDIRGRLVTGYTRPDFSGKKRLPIGHSHTHAMSPATGFYSTAADICKYFSAHVLGSGLLLSDESKKEMQRAHWQAENVYDKEEYGLGFELEHTKKRHTFGHGGGFPGHITHTMCDPKDELVVTVLTNGMDSRVTFLAKSVLNLIDFFQKKWQPPKKGFEKLDGRYMDLWSINDIVASGTKLYCGFSSWWVFDDPDEFEHVSGTDFKVTKTSSFGIEGEMVKFQLDKDGNVREMSYANSHTYPERDYLARTAHLKKIDSPE